MDNKKYIDPFNEEEWEDKWVTVIDYKFTIKKWMSVSAYSFMILVMTFLLVFIPKVFGEDKEVGDGAVIVLFIYYIIIVVNLISRINKVLKMKNEV